MSDTEETHSVGVAARLARSSLGWKLFLSHLLVVVVGVSILGIVAYLHAPAALSNHVSRMEALIGVESHLANDLRGNFLAAVGEILVVAGLSAAVAAVVVSTFVAVRIVGPIRSLTRASRRIADGDYGERVEAAWNDELAELAESFNRMAERLRSTEERRVELIGNLAHELKTPLASIRSMMEGLVDGVLPPDVETFLDVQHEALRLQRLTNELSELSRAEAGEIPLRYEPTNVRNLLDRAATRLRPQFDDKDVALTVRPVDGLPPVMVDQERILQVLINLLGNALQYTPSGGTVEVGAAARDAMMDVYVRDSGIGIAPDELPRLFDRFYRVDKSRARSGGGSGIGLTIASHLVRAHGGAITVDSSGLGGGSTFRFTIPIGRNVK